MSSPIFTRYRALSAGLIRWLGCLLPIAMYLMPVGARQTAPLTCVSAASYEQSLAPGAITAAFGVNLAPRVEIASTVPLPTSLAGTRVMVNGVAAGLFFVSSGQINFLIPPDIQPGQATVTVQSGVPNTSPISATLVLRATAPAIFTANGSGIGVPAATAIRVKADGTQVFESVLQFDNALNRFIAKPIDLGPSSEQVFLILFLTGIRRADQQSVKVLLGSLELTPAYAGPAPGFEGLEQINVLLPRSIQGTRKAALAVRTPDAVSNVAELEFAAAGTPPRIIAFAPNPVLAGDVITISGENFAIAGQNQVVFEGLSGQVLAASAAQLRVLVPFGVQTGQLKVTTPSGEATVPFSVRTSISGFVQDGAGRPIPGIVVKTIGSSVAIASTTNLEGVFLLPDVPASFRQLIQIDGTTGSGLSYTSLNTSGRVTAGRDNQLDPIFLQLIQSVPDTGLVRTTNATLELPSGVIIRDAQGQATALTMMEISPNQLLAEIPAGHFSALVVSILPNQAVITPGGKLILKNLDGYPVGAPVTLFRLDQIPGSATAGSFINVGQAMVSADGQRIETATNAVTQASYYFASVARPQTTVIGRTVDSNGQPIAGVTVRVRGRSAKTDSNGGFVVSGVGANAGERFVVEATFVSAGGSVRAHSNEVGPEVGGVTLIPNIVLPLTTNRPPRLNVPLSATIKESESKDITILADDPDSQPIQVSISGSSFATLINQGNGTYAIRLVPGTGTAGTYSLRVTVADSLGATTSANLAITVERPENRAPTATSTTISLDEDTPIKFRLGGTDADNDPLTFTITKFPSHGILSGSAVSMFYEPAKDFNGSDSFQFKVSDGRLESAAATISLTINPINDAPVLMLPSPQTISADQQLRFEVSATDVDAGQTATITAANLPQGATLTPLANGRVQFTWTPTRAQAGSYTINFQAQDNGTPSLVDNKGLLIKVGAPVAEDQFGLVLDEDTTLAITVRGRDLGGLPITYLLGQPPKNGVLTGGFPNLTYHPNLNYNGPDSFTFKVNNGSADSVEAVVSLRINPVNDPPMLIVPGPQTVRVGDGLLFEIRAMDPDEDQSLRFSRQGVPDDALFLQPTSSSRQIFWTPTASQAGNYVFSFNVTDSGELGDNKTVTVKVEPATPTAEWRRADGVDISSFAQALAGDDTNLYVGTAGAGVFRTSNQGQRYERISRAPLDIGVNAFTMALRGQVLFVGAAGASNEGVFRSDNRGETWTTINNGLPTNRRNVSLLKEIDQALYVGTDSGLFRLNDTGDKWLEFNNGLSNQRVFALAGNGTNLLAGTACGGLYTTSTASPNWQSMAVIQGVLNVRAIVTLNDAWLVGANRDSSCSTPNSEGLYRSTNNGATWVKVTSGLPAGIQVNALLIRGTEIYAAANYGVFVSNDSGLNWRQLNYGFLFQPEKQVNALGVTGNTLHAGTALGVFRRTF